MKIREWSADAVADGWKISPTYSGEDVGTAFSLAKNGWTASGIVRGNPADSLCIWGPDSLQVKVPEVYSMASLIEALKICQYCDAKDIPTSRVSFAGRCCLNCLPEQKRRLEYPGWTN